jgi:hypothetical protein
MVAAATILAAVAASADCGRCHVAHLEDWRKSAHARATSSALYRLLATLSRADHARAGQPDDDSCAACHGTEDGVGCPICHAVAGIDEHQGAQGRARMKAAPPDTYFGPIDGPAEARVHRSSASAIHRDERICAPCHDHDVNGVPCCTVLREWRASQTSDFMTCQSCHMRAVAGRNAARDGPSRTIHRHRFPGSDDPDQLRAGWDAQIREAARAGPEVRVTVAVKNRAGHSLPNGEPFAGSVLLRVEALDLAGNALASDERSFGFEMLDAAGSPTVLRGRVARRGASSTLVSGETREERFRLVASGAVAIAVTLWHVPFDPPPAARKWMDDLRAWMGQEKGKENRAWLEEIDGSARSVDTLARPRLFWRLSRSL